MRNTFRPIAGSLIGQFMPRLAYPVVRGPLKGARFILGSLSGEGGGSTVYLNLVEPQQTKVFVDLLKKGQVCFDVGANVGYYTILGSRCVGSSGMVIAFEPAVRNLAYLYRHVQLNKAENVIIISAACSDTLSLAIFSAGKNYAEGHIRTGNFADAASCEKVSLVPTVTIDDVSRQLSMLPHVIKIDVEGAELSVLKGAKETLRKSRPKILLSTHSDELRSSCLAFLQELGYKQEPLWPTKDNPTEFLAQFDT